MRTSPQLALCLGLVAASLPAQKMGSVNALAPRVTQSIQYVKGAKIEVSYTAITTAKGKTLASLLDKERGERMRSFFNRMADRRPLGRLDTSAPITLAGQTLAAGEYDLCFKIDEELQWTLNLVSRTDKNEVKSFDLEPGTTEKQLGRLQMLLTPGAEPGAGTLSIRFAHLAADFALGGKPKTTSRPQK